MLFGSWEYLTVMNKEKGTEIIVDWEDKTRVRMSAAQLYEIIFDGNNKWMLSANGTIFANMRHRWTTETLVCRTPRNATENA